MGIRSECLQMNNEEKQILEDFREHHEVVKQEIAMAKLFIRKTGIKPKNPQEVIDWMKTL